MPSPGPTVAPTLSPTTCGERFVHKSDNGKLNWNQCEAACEAEGLRMPCIVSAEEDDALLTAMQGASNAWLGLKKQGQDLVWEDSCGSTYTNANFNTANGKTCVAIRRRGRVHEVPESEGHEPLLRRRQLEGEV